MTAKRILTAAALAACVGCAAIVSCGESDFGETLRWRSAIEIPLNYEHKVGRQLDHIDYSSIDGDKGGVLIDLGVDTISIASDAMDVVKKLDDLKISYRAIIANNTSVRLTLYGLLFPENDGAATVELLGFYGMAVASAQTGQHIKLMGTGGLTIEPGAIDSVSMLPEPQDRPQPLHDLIIESSAVSWRWLAWVEEPPLNDTTNTRDNIRVKLVIEASGVNSFDSLFTINSPRAGVDAFISSRGGASP